MKSAIGRTLTSILHGTLRRGLMRAWVLVVRPGGGAEFDPVGATGRILASGLPREQR